MVVTGTMNSAKFGRSAGLAVIVRGLRADLKKIDQNDITNPVHKMNAVVNILIKESYDEDGSDDEVIKFNLNKTLFFYDPMRMKKKRKQEKVKANIPLKDMNLEYIKNEKAIQRVKNAIYNFKGIPTSAFVQKNKIKHLENIPKTMTLDPLEKSLLKGVYFLSKPQKAALLGLLSVVGFIIFYFLKNKLKFYPFVQVDNQAPTIIESQSIV